MRHVEFWFDFASTYSYLSAVRIEGLAKEAGVAVVWRPFLLGPIFRRQGWETSPFNVYPAKGRYMRRDMERICRSRGLDFSLPAGFPLNGLQAARVALALGTEEEKARFCREVFIAEFARGQDIGREDVLEKILKSLGVEQLAAFSLSRSDKIKQQLRLQTEVAAERGIFGAPSFVTADGELFWGDDRLQMALGWAQQL